MKTYVLNLWCALCGRPVCIIKEVEKKVIEVRDLSMTTADMRDASNTFVIERWKRGATLEDFARSEGEQRVIRWFKDRIGSRVGKVGQSHVL